jgi:hypothetical protein
LSASLTTTLLSRPNLGAKYEPDLREIDQPGESRVVVTIEPVNVYAVDMTGS